MSSPYSHQEHPLLLAITLTPEHIAGLTSLPLCERRKILRRISIIQSKIKQMSGNNNIVEVVEDYENLLKEGDRKMMNKLEDIKTLQARVEFLKSNLRGAVKMYKEEKERRQFAEKELIKVKESLKDPVNEARKAGL